VDLIDKNTGELIDDKFAKMFFEDIGLLFSLTAMQKDLLFVMLRDCKYGNNINMTPKRKKIYVDEIGYKSVNSLNSGLKRLENTEVVQRDEEGSTLYIINPNIFFKGNDYQRAIILTKYSSGKREIQVYQDEDIKINN
jgi:hypothetical protein